MSAFTRRFRPLTRALRRAVQPPDYRTLVRRVGDLERNQAGLLKTLYPTLSGDLPPRMAFQSRELKVFSQNGEDGLIAHLLESVGPTDRRFVEIGIGDGRECNSANLILNFGWSGLLVDCGRRDVEAARHYYYEERGVPQGKVAIAECLVTAENVEPLLEEHGMKGEIDLLSIDIDSNDYWVWKAIRSLEPRIVVIEYNASFGPTEPRIVVYQPEFDPKAYHSEGWYHGASIAALAALGTRRGYRLVGCDSAGVNAFFVRRDLAPDTLPEQAPADAYFPHRRRLRHASQAGQFEAIRNVEFATDE